MLRITGLPVRSTFQASKGVFRSFLWHRICRQEVRVCRILLRACNLSSCSTTCYVERFHSLFPLKSCNSSISERTTWRAHEFCETIFLTKLPRILIKWILSDYHHNGEVVLTELLADMVCLSWGKDQNSTLGLYRRVRSFPGGTKTASFLNISSYISRTWEIQDFRILWSCSNLVVR